jgi:hypothetical protein
LRPPERRGYRRAVTLDLALTILLGAVLIAAAGAKAAAPRASQEALATFRLRSPGARRWVWAAAAALEAGLGAAVIAGSDAAALAAAALMLVFAAALSRALAAGGAGAPCGCFGPRSRVSRGAVARTLLLAAGLAAVPFVPAVTPSPDAWLAAGLGLALAACAALCVALAGLAREVGTLRLAIAPQAALELEHEGPELGSRSDVVERLPERPGARLGLAVFTSQGCAACRALEPAVDYVTRDPLVAAARFDEHLDADVWRALDVPGSPFAVALGLDGTVLAKGTFNTLGQLEGVLAAAERRARQAANA